VSASLLRVGVVVQPGQIYCNSGQGLEAAVVERRMSRREEDVHGADERCHERPRDVRPGLMLDEGAAEPIR
jgi:hypothetical protein